MIMDDIEPTCDKRKLVEPYRRKKYPANKRGTLKDMDREFKSKDHLANKKNEIAYKSHLVQSNNYKARLSLTH